MLLLPLHKELGGLDLVLSHLSQPDSSHELVSVNVVSGRVDFCYSEVGSPCDLDLIVGGLEFEGLEFDVTSELVELVLEDL